MSKRDEKGRFVAGNGGGPGRPKKEREARFLEITLSAVTYEEWRAIIKKAVSQAKRGNAQARKFLADYLVGPPLQQQEIRIPDGIRIEKVEIVRDYGESDSGSGTDQE